MSVVKFQVSGVTCDISGVTCQVSRVTFFTESAPPGQFSHRIGMTVCAKKEIFHPLWRRQRKKSIGAIISIGREIRCLPYAGFLKYNIKYETTALFHSDEATLETMSCQP